MDIDIIIAETDFQKAKQILMDVGYTNVLGDNLCARFEHECFLPVDLFTSPLYGPDPSKTNTTIYEEHIIFCNLPGKFSNIKGYHYLVSAIVLSSKSGCKQMRDHVDLCELIVAFNLGKEYGKDNNFDIVTQSAYERIYNEYYENNIKSYINLGTEMKLLNDKKQFEKALALFDQHGVNNILTLSNFTLTQVLKACAHVGDLQRGKIIHNLIASKTKNDIYVSSTLIHLYVHCADVASAKSLFDSIKNKTPAMYGIMMKGYIKNKQANKAIALFNEIQNPNDVHMILLFNSCAQLKTKEALDLVKK
ncbi:unnamed protein product, partial [Rotaria magnacalcarata]